jgi:predicted secreted hydrolase
MAAPMDRRSLLATLAAAAAAGPLRSAALAPRRLAFPADFGAHPQQQIEWWYATGHLVESPGLPADSTSPAGAPEFGFQITFFRRRTRVDPAHPSRFAARQLLFAHAAVTDLRRRRLRHDQRSARTGFGLAEFDTADTRLELRDWSLVRSGPVERSRYLAQLHSPAVGFGFRLDLQATQAVLLQGDAGWSRKGPQPDQASHYYSQPQLAVQGSLQLDSREFTVRGLAWLDHEWSDSALDAQAVGWDWIGMNLDDGSALTAFRLRRADHTTLYAGGSLRRLDGAQRTFEAHEVRFVPARHWTSPHSAARYPVQWSVETPGGRFDVRALLDDQELDSRATTGAVYWEGLSELLDASGRRIGLGYLEMTGYAGALRL